MTNVSAANLRSACAIAPPLNSQAFHECQGGANSARTPKELAFASSKEIAFETIHYAVECLMHGEMKSFAIDVIYENDNGLTEAQKQAISLQIRALSDRPRTVKGLNQLVNRLIGAVQPATLQVLASSKLLAEVLYFSLGPRLRSPSWQELQKTIYRDPLNALSIQLPRREIERNIVRRHMRDKVSLNLNEIHAFLQEFHGKRSGNFFLVSGDFWTVEEIQQLLAEAPKFSKLIIHDFYNTDFLTEVAQAIREGNTQFRKLSDKTTERNILSFDENIALFLPHLSELKVKRYLEKGELAQLVKTLPSLEQLSLGCRVNDAKLLMLKQLPHLHTLTLCNCKQITTEGIEAFAQENASIKTIILQKTRITQQDISWLKSTFPHIHFVIDVESAK